MPPLRHVLLVLPLVMSGCSGVQVDTQHDPFTDFAAYTTFAFPGASIREEDPAAGDLDAAGIEAAISRALTAQGMQAAPPDSATLLVSHRLHMETKVQVNDPYYSFEAVEYYEEGTLVLDFLDRATERRVWHGSGATRLKGVDDPEQRAALIERAVDAILKQYPPEPR